MLCTGLEDGQGNVAWWSIVVSLLAVGVAYYAIHEQAARERSKGEGERRDRRRERLILLFSQWASRVLEITGLCAAWVDCSARQQKLRELPPDRISPRTVDVLLRVEELIALGAANAMRDLNQAAQAIQLEEGEALWQDVEDLTGRALRQFHKVSRGEGNEGAAEIVEDLKKAMHHKRVALSQK